MSDKEMSRRSFLYAAGALAAGLAAGGLAHQLAQPVNDAVEEATGHPTGNANLQEALRDNCADGADVQICVEEQQKSLPYKVITRVLGPLLEEGVFRALPSAILSTLQGSREVEAEVKFGTGGVGMNRDELLVGGTSAVVFAAYHNLTPSGVDTTTIPASQLADGMIYWYLQRKLGFASNTLAHAVFNWLGSV